MANHAQLNLSQEALIFSLSLFDMIRGKNITRLGNLIRTKTFFVGNLRSLYWQNQKILQIFVLLLVVVTFYLKLEKNYIVPQKIYSLIYTNQNNNNNNNNNNNKNNNKQTTTATTPKNKKKITFNKH